MSQYDYDLLTIGAGSGGVRTSRLTAATGKRVAVVEASRYGGTCVIRGCVPKKLLWYGAHMGDDIADAVGYGWQVETAHHDWPALMTAKDQEISRLEGIYQRLLREAGCTLINGRGRVVDPHTVEVDGRTYTAERILVAVGGRPALPAVPGIEHALTSNEALELPTLPKRLVVVGGGYIAVEFAGVFSALGVEVTQILRGDAVLRGFDQDVRAALMRELATRGITVQCGSVVRSIERLEDGTLSLRLAMGETVETDAVLYATGRVPATEGLGLQEAGVALDPKGAVITDDLFRTSVSSIFALGDVTDRVNLTPVAIREAMAFVSTYIRGEPVRVDYDLIPTAVFSHPPIGTVGLTEAEAREQGRAVDIYVSRFRPMRHTLSGRDEHTMMKVIVCRETDRVLGLHMVGLDAPEITQGFAVAMKAGATKAHFDATVGIHPTSAEEFVTMREPRPDPCPSRDE